VALQTLDLSATDRAATKAVTSVDSTDGLVVTLAAGTAVVLLRATHGCSWRWAAADSLVPLDSDTWLSVPGLGSGGLPASTRLEVRANSSAATVYVAVS
jgi:hypothetical protein